MKIEILDNNEIVIDDEMFLLMFQLSYPLNKAGAFSMTVIYDKVEKVNFNTYLFEKGMPLIMEFETEDNSFDNGLSPDDIYYHNSIDYTIKNVRLFNDFDDVYQCNQAERFV